jgi:hypothetical protein
MVDPVDDPTLREWRETYRATLAQGSAACPDADRLVALLVGGPEGEARQDVADHVVTCSRCHAAFRKLVALHESAESASREESSSRRWRRTLALAAAISLVAVGLWVTVWKAPGRDRVPAPRGPAAASAATEPPDLAVLAEPPRSFRWAAEDGVESFRVVLYDRESTPIWESPDLVEPALDLPAAVRDAMVPGRYYWHVVRYRGVEEERSALHRFSIEP